jgi:hypothetical protein
MREDYVKTAFLAGQRAALVKLGFGPEDANRVLSLAKAKQLPKASARVVPQLAAVRGLRQKQIDHVTNMQTQHSPVGGQATSNMSGHIFPGQGSLGNQMGQAAPAFRSIPASQQKMFHAVAKGHELDELSVRPSPGALVYGHLSPDVILREHNRIVTLPPGNEQISAAFRDLRKTREGLDFMPDGMQYGQGERLSRHARKRITEGIARRKSVPAKPPVMTVSDVDYADLPLDIQERLKQGHLSALSKFGLDDTRSSPYSLDVHMPSTSPEGRETMIDQAFNTNDQLGEYGQTADGFASTMNNVLQPGAPPVSEEEGRHFAYTTDQSGGDL